MSTVEQILGEFIDAWKAGERPDVDAYLARARESDRHTNQCKFHPIHDYHLQYVT